jgi:hypothetical protein
VLSLVEGYYFSLPPSTFPLVHAGPKPAFQVCELALMMSKAQKERGVGPEKAGQEGNSSSDNRHCRALVGSSEEYDAICVVDDLLRLSRGPA